MSENYGPAQGPGPVPNYGGPGYGPQGTGAPPTPAKKPIWKRTWFIATAAGLLGLMLGAGGSSDATVTPKAAPTVTTTATATVTETSTPEPAPTVTATVTETAAATEPPKPDPEPVKNQEPATTAGLREGMAVQTCGSIAETALKNSFPGSKIKVHSILGVLAANYRADSDSWFVKIEGKVDSNPINIECTVAGSEDNPSVDDVFWY